MKRQVFYLILLIAILSGMGIRKVNALSKEIPVLVINQIRGYETCCEGGSEDMLKVINSETRFQELPLSWAIRYDVLTDDAVSNFQNLPKSQTLGILLEVTPELASSSGVLYKGDLAGSDWYSAHNAFLIGYLQSERKKILDTVFKTFYEKLSYYPTFTVSWMIDSWSLNYIRNTYGVRVHEITKEQFETDGYTLYGGVFNLAYFPLQSHPLVPAKSKSEGIDLLMIRQTISDIDKNYGSYASFYTSQPNDYLGHPTSNGFSYFTGLFDEVSSQQDISKFAVLGLENSREWQSFKEEYLKQLAWISQKHSQGTIKVMTPQEYYNFYQNNFGENQPRILKSRTFPEAGSLWYFGKDYRARIEIWDKGVTLTDFRIYSPAVDPYRDAPVLVNRGYWIIPYLVDSSQQFSLVNPSESLYKGQPVRSDTGVERFGILLIPEKIKDIHLEDDSAIISGDTARLRLTPNFITLESSSSPVLLSPINLSLDKLFEINTEQYFTFRSHPRFYLAPDSKIQEVLMGWENQDLQKVSMAKAIKDTGVWKIIPNIDLSSAEIDSLAAIFQPDKTRMSFDPTSSTFFWHNTEAIADRSPVRLYVDPRNVLGRPVALKKFTATILGSDDIAISQPVAIETRMEPFLIDFTATRSAQALVKLNADGNIISGETTIHFYRDCTKEIVTCIKDTNQLKSFSRVFIRDSYQEFSNRLGELLDSARQKIRPFIQRKS